MSASWPTSVATDSTLYLAVNELQNNLSGAINNSVTTVGLNSTTGFPSVGLVLIDNEVIKYGGISGNNLTSCTRAFDGTTAAAHSSAAVVSFAFCAAHHNGLKDEVIAIETSLNLTASRALSSDTNGRVAVATTTLAELNFVSGVTSAIQTQLNGKVSAASPTFSGTITTPLTASRVVTSNASSQLAVSTCTTTEIDFVHGVTSAIQTQLDGKASTTGTLLTTTDQTATGIKTFSGQLIGKGTATNDDAAAGYIGEYVSSIDNSGASVGASGTYFDITSISLTAGDWDISLFVSYGRNGATITSNDYEIGIGTATGNNAAGLAVGDTLLRANANYGASFIFCDLALPAVRKSLASTTTIYAKGYFDGYSTATPKKFYRMVARRVR